jgi:hypothetical protein
MCAVCIIMFVTSALHHAVISCIRTARFVVVTLQTVFAMVSGSVTCPDGTQWPLNLPHLFKSIALG